MIKRQYRLGRVRLRTTKRYHAHYLTIIFTYSPLTYPRFAVTVSKKVSPHATIRNKLRRQMYQWIEANLAQIKAGIDTIVILNRQSSESTKEELWNDLEKTLRKAGTMQ